MNLTINKFSKYFPILSIVFVSTEAADVMHDPIPTGDSNYSIAAKRKHASIDAAPNKQLKIKKDSLPNTRNKPEKDTDSAEDADWQEKARKVSEFLDEEERLEKGLYKEEDGDLE